MNPEKLEALKKREQAIYKQEISRGNELKLRVLHDHLYIEHLLERYISTKLRTTDGLFGQNGLTFEKKLCLAKSFQGLNSESVDSIRKLNKLRNDLVHKFKHQPTEAEIDDFGRTFGKAYKEMKGSLVKERHSLLERFCDRLCGQMCCIVVDAENPPI